MKTFSARTISRWRAWLDVHHDSESEVWLICYKLHTGKTCISYQDALDEALCYGWVDSLVKRLDENRYARKFTPRRPDSKWSAINRRRYAELKAEGRLKAPGVARPPTDRTYAPHPRLPPGVPPYIQQALGKHPAARRTFERLSPSHQRQYVGWIHTAKQNATKERRLKEAVRLLSAGQKLGLK